MKSSLIATVLCLCVLSACSGTSAKTEAPKSQPPAKVSNAGVKEGDLASIVLTPQAELRLGIQTAEVRHDWMKRSRTYAGDIVVPPGQAHQVTAPVAGTLTRAEGGPLTPGMRVRRGQALFRVRPMLPVERDLRTTLDAEVEAAKTRVETAKVRVARADRLYKDGAGSLRALEDTRQELSFAETALEAAQAKLARLLKSPTEAEVAVTISAPESGIVKQAMTASGQAISSGAILADIEQLDTVWVRVPVYAGEVAQIAKGTPATVRSLKLGASESGGRHAEPVTAPPSGDPVAATVDVFYRLANPDIALRPGEKVSVSVPIIGRQRSLQAPWAAILHDIHGGTWLYEHTGPHTYTRRRVDVESVSNGVAYLSRGVREGARVVIAGAAELFGTEFGAGK